MKHLTALEVKVQAKMVIKSAYKSLRWTVTMLESLFGVYHTSSGALGLQCPEVTKQPLVSDWSATLPLWC